MRLGRSRKSDSRQRLRYEGTQATTFAYRAKRSESAINLGRGDARPDKKKIADHRFWLQRTGIIVLSLALVVSGINVLLLSRQARLVVLSGGQTSPQLLQIYQSAADKELASSIWNRNKITINTGAISQQLEQQFPQLANVSVTIPLVAHRPVVYIQPAQAALIMTNNTGAYTISTAGEALIRSSSAQSLQTSSPIPVVNDNSGLTVKTGQQVLSAGSVAFIETVYDQLTAQHIAVSGFVLPPAANELDAQLTGRAYLLKFNLANNDARQQTGTAIATLAQLQSQNITPGKYIDVRVDGRAYYQ